MSDFLTPEHSFYVSILDQLPERIRVYLWAIKSLRKEPEMWSLSPSAHWSTTKILGTGSTIHCRWDLQFSQIGFEIPRQPAEFPLRYCQLVVYVFEICCGTSRKPDYAQLRSTIWVSGGHHPPTWQRYQHSRTDTCAHASVQFRVRRLRSSNISLV